MSWMRCGWAMKYFRKCRTYEYVFPTGNEKKSWVEDYGSQYTHKPSLIELIGNFIATETGSEEYAWKMVRILAKDYGISHLLRKKPATWKQIWRETERHIKKDKLIQKFIRKK